MRNGITDAEGHGPQQQVHRAVPVIRFHFGDVGTGAAGTGIVEDDVDTARFIACAVHQRLYGSRIADIALGKAHVTRSIGGQFLAPVDIDIGGENDGTFAGEQRGCSSADSRRCASNDYGLARESHAYSLPEFLRFKLRGALRRVNAFRLTLRQCGPSPVVLHMPCESP